MVENLGDLKLPPPAHIGVIVKSLEESSDYYSKVFGLGPWTFVDNNPTKEQMLVGEPFKLTVCFANWGPVVLELLEPRGGKSIWADFLEEHGEGIHHTCHAVPNFEEVVSDLQQQGGKMIAGSWFKTIRWCYLEFEPSGLVLEVMEEGEL